MLFPTITESSKSEQISTSIKNGVMTTDGSDVNINYVDFSTV